MSTAILATLIDNAYRRDGLAELQVHETASGFQAIAKYKGALKGPWGVGVADTPAKAIRDALSREDEGVFA